MFKLFGKETGSQTELHYVEVRKLEKPISLSRCCLNENAWDEWFAPGYLTEYDNLDDYGGVGPQGVSIKSDNKIVEFEKSVWWRREEVVDGLREIYLKWAGKFRWGSSAE